MKLDVIKCGYKSCSNEFIPITSWQRFCHVFCRNSFHNELRRLQRIEIKREKGGIKKDEIIENKA